MMPKGKLIIIGGAVDKGSFTENAFAEKVDENLNFFEKGILKTKKNPQFECTILNLQSAYTKCTYSTSIYCTVCTSICNSTRLLHHCTQIVRKTSVNYNFVRINIFD